MGSYQRGSTITLEAELTNGRTGVAVDADAGSKSFIVYKDGAVIETIADSDINTRGTGLYYYDWDTDETLTKGLYVYEFKAKVAGKDVITSAILRIKQRKST